MGSVLVPEEFLLLDDVGTKGTFSASANNASWVASALARQNPVEFGQLLLRSLTGSGVRLDTDLAPQGFRHTPMRGYWAAVESPPVGSTADEVFDSFQMVFPELKRVRKLTKPTLFGLTFDEEVQQGVMSTAWVFLAVQWVKGGDGATGYPRRALLRGLRYTREDLMVRVPELRMMPSKTAAVVGQGALGGDFNFEIARSQIGTLRLADYDFADPAASVRGADGVPASGIHKAGYQAAKLRMHFPLLKVEPLNLNIGQAPRGSLEPGQHERQLVSRLVSGADLVVDTTANENVTLVLSRASEWAKVPLIAVWGVDGYGGVVIRLRPGVTGCFYCFLLRRAPEYEVQDRILPPPAAITSTPIQPRGCTDLTVTATGFDLSILANQAARVAVSTLVGGESGGYPTYADDVWVLSIRDPDGSLLPAPQWSSYALPPHAGCPSCR